jgi:hypothetical protein
MKHLRTNKSRKALDRLKVRPAISIDRSEMDKKVFDLVLKTLYNNVGKNGLHVENEIFASCKISLPAHETSRLWEVMTSSGWVSPVIGFGNAGKLELTKAGFQLMSQFGGYSEYLTSVQNSQQQPQTIILPIQIQGEEEQETEKQEIHPLPETNKVAQKLQKKKRGRG